MPQIATETYIEGIKTGDRVLLSRAISLVESTVASHETQAQEILEACLPYSGKSIRIGITGVPGVGKSTLIDALGMHILKQKKKLAVLAIDPTSEKTKGSILGDKTRMEHLSLEPNAFIRPTATSGNLGGVAPKTRETMLLCEAAGFDVILIETVGVGQSETFVQSMVDFFLLLMLSGAGDELQGIKRGIMEWIDALILTKADGENVLKAKQEKATYKRALHYLQPREHWQPVVQTCSAMTQEGIPEIWQTILQHHNQTKANGWYVENRKKQSLYWLHQSIEKNLIKKFYTNPNVQEMLATLEKEVMENQRSPYHATQQLLELFLAKKAL